MKSHSPPAGKGPHRDLAKERSWRNLIKQFAAGRQSVREFCAAHRLKETAFYFWRSEIQRRDSQAPAREQRSVCQPLAFTKVLVQTPVSDEGLRLRLGNGRELLLPASWPVERLTGMASPLPRHP